MRKALLIGVPRSLAYDRDWIDAFKDYYQVTLVNAQADAPRNINKFHIVVLLHSLTAQGDIVPDWVKRDRGKTKLLLFTGNDYKLFEEKQKLIDELEPELTATLAPRTPYKGKNIVHVPHALNPKFYFSHRAYHERHVRVGFRGIRYPAKMGLRNQAVEAFKGREGCDIKFEIFRDPMHYSRWLSKVKATVATEAGADKMTAVSSRHFETIGSGAVLIMTKGKYSGCLDPDHYVTLKDDLSNVEECLELIDDPKRWEALSRHALHHVLSHHTYKHRILDIMKRVDLTH